MNNRRRSCGLTQPTPSHSRDAAGLPGRQPGDFCRFAMGLLVASVIVPMTGCSLVQSNQSVEIERWEMAQTPLDRSAAKLDNDIAENLFWADTFYERIMSVEGDRTVENTLIPFNHMHMHLEASASECSLLFNVHPAESVRTMAEKGEQKIAQRRTELLLDRDLFEAIKAVDLDDADAKTKYFVKKVLREFRHNGVDRSDEERARIAALQEEILSLGQSFARNIAGDVREITVESPAELDGLPKDWIAKHKPAADGKIHITTQYPDSVPVLNYAHNADVRQRMFQVYRNRGYPANIAVLDQLIARRHELATLLGYSSYADYITEDKMIRSAEATEKFIDRLAKAGKAAAEREKQMLLARKRQDMPNAEHI
ncbi:MAG: M3 family metallopeptidase, partial [Phycisphaerae bacterium]